jgi:hypothetical protein
MDNTQGSAHKLPSLCPLLGVGCIAMSTEPGGNTKGEPTMPTNKSDSATGFNNERADVWDRFEQSVRDLARDIPSEELDEWFEQLKTKLNDIQISIEKQRGMV